MGGGKHKSSGHPHSVHVRRAKSGGYIATHHHKPDEDGVMPEPEEHVIPDADALQAHMSQAMGDQPPAPPPAPDPNAGAAGPAVASPQPGM